MANSWRKRISKAVKITRSHGILGLLKIVRQRRLDRYNDRVFYPQWVAQHPLTPQDIRSAQEQMAQWRSRPTFSVIMPVYNVKAEWLERAIDSVLNQIYPDWELCIADDASPKPHIKTILTRYSQRDPRIKVEFRSENGHISAASNSAIDLATRDYITLLDHDDELTPDALFEMARTIVQHPDADFIYSDEDKIDERGKRHNPFFKPDWSPEYFQAAMYTCHLGVFRTRLIRAIGGFRVGYEGSQDYDLVLRVVENTRNIYHVRKVLYHWRVIPESAASGGEAKPWAYTAAGRALEDMLARSDYPGRVEATQFPGMYRLRRKIIGQPLVSLVISNAEARSLQSCLDSLNRSTYRTLELMLITDTPIALPHSDFPIQQVSKDGQTIALTKATGEFLLLLDGHLEVITPDWIETLLELAQQPEIGAVGAKLLSPDRRILHAGLVWLGDSVQSAYYGYDDLHPGYCGSNVITRNYLAVSGECLMMRRSRFEQLGGLDEAMGSYSAIDLCLKAHRAGYRNVVTPDAQLVQRRPIPPDLQDWERLKQRWQPYLAQWGGDPYYHPVLDQTAATFLFAGRFSLQTRQAG